MSSPDPLHKSVTQPVRTRSAPESFMPETEVGVIDSAELFKGASELRVRHRGDEYRLRITRQGKLILTK